MTIEHLSDKNINKNKRIIKQDLAWHIIASNLQDMFQFNIVDEDKELKKRLENLLEYVSEKTDTPDHKDYDKIYVVLEQNEE